MYLNEHNQNHTMNFESSLNYEQILLKDSLFTEYSLLNVAPNEIINLLYHIDLNEHYNHLKIIDSYCTICKKDTTFQAESTDEQNLSDLLIKSGMIGGFPGNNKKNTLLENLEKLSVFTRKFNCPRHPKDSSHSQLFVFRVIGTTLIKIGQHPTLADLSKIELKKYRKLSEDIYSELNRAVGLITHGVGIGSFVYLRRIIEKHIVMPKINELLTEGKTSLEDLAKTDFKGKIDLAKDRLPTFLVENKKIYSILSKGMHELEENECKEYFPILRTAIEIILDEQIEKAERDKKNRLIAEQINKIN